MQPSRRAASKAGEVGRWAVFGDVDNSLASEDMVGEVSESEACTTLSIRAVVELGIRNSLLRSYTQVDLNRAVDYYPGSNVPLLDRDSHGLDHGLVRQTHEHSSVDRSA
jgi:hypothetical protein